MKEIDHCYYINLDHRTDRDANIVDFVLPFFRVEDRFTRFSAFDTSGERSLPLRSVGCARSHLGVLKDAILNGYNSILILEDDFMPILNPTEFHEKWNYFTENFPDYNLCQLSYNNISKAIPCDESNIVYSCDNSQTASGYVIKTSFAQKMIRNISHSITQLENNANPDVFAYDQSWKKFQSIENKWYQLERCGIQSFGYSDLEKKLVNYNC
jgi:glycosyl transferase family 25